MTEKKTPLQRVLDALTEECRQFGEDIQQEASFLSELLEEIEDIYSDVRQQLREEELREKFKGDD